MCVTFTVGITFSVVITFSDDIPFRDHNSGLRRSCPVKATYSDREIHKLTNRDVHFTLRSLDPSWKSWVVE